MTLDALGEVFIKGFEDLKLLPYLDIRKRPTIGWGHTAGVTMETRAITEQEAELYFESDVSDAEVAVNRTTIQLTQNEFNALVSFTFNEGTGRFLTSTLFAKLNLGDRRGAAKEFSRWIYYHDPVTLAPKVSSDLVERRAREKALFLSDFAKSQSVENEI